MTDGIIQQVFRSYRGRVNDTDKILLQFVKQELIEKIKQEFPTDEIPDKSSEIEMIPVGNINIEVRRILIGDNQE